MENTKVLNKGLFTEVFSVLSATAALNLSLIIYTMHNYFNFFGATHAALLTVLVFYGLAAAGYYVLCFKDSNKYETPTLFVRVLSLVFYASIAVAVFSAYKMYVNSLSDYIIAFFASCVIGGFIKDITAFAVYTTTNIHRCVELMVIPVNLFFMVHYHVIFQFNEGNLPEQLVWLTLIINTVVYGFYYYIKSNILDYEYTEFTGHLALSFVLSAATVMINKVISYAVDSNLLIAMPLFILVLFIINILHTLITMDD